MFVSFDFIVSCYRVVTVDSQYQLNLKQMWPMLRIYPKTTSTMLSSPTAKFRAHSVSGKKTRGRELYLIEMHPNNNKSKLRFPACRQKLRASASAAQQTRYLC